MTKEKEIEEIIIKIYKEYPNFLAHDEFCFDNKAKFGEPCTECSKELRKYLEQSFLAGQNSQKEKIFDMIDSIFYSGGTRMEEYTWLKLKKKLEEELTQKIKGDKI